MNRISEDLKNKGVVVYTVYTREPHAGEIIGGFDFSARKETKSYKDRANYAKILIEEHGLKYPILIDLFGSDCIQERLGGGAPNSVIVIDREGKVALWQVWADPTGLRRKLEEMTGGAKQ